MKRIFWTFLTLLFFVTACGNPMPSTVDILTPEEIPGSFEGPTITDNTGTSVVVRFITGVPTACNITFGTDTGYGTVAMMEMMGGGTREHSITLTDLTPGTTYHYRLNLTDEQAHLYQSQDLTFTTATAGSEVGGDQPEAAQVNVASYAAGARVIDVSSNYGGGANDSSWGANNTIDGQANTQWSSDGDGDEAWIEIEMAQVYDVHTVGFWTRTMNNNTAQIFRFTITTDQGETFGPFDLPDADRLHTFPIELTARRLRFDAVETNTGNTGAVEIAVYGTPRE